MPAGSGDVDDRAVKRWFERHRLVAEALAAVAIDGVWRNLHRLPELDRRRLARSNHALCALLATTARRGRPAADPAFTQGVVDAVAECLTLDGAGSRHGLVGTVLGIAALTACPDVAWHPEVQHLGTGPAVVLRRNDLDWLADGWTGSPERCRPAKPA